MSFSTELKKEISELGNLSNKEAVRYELIGYLISSNISEEKNKIKFSTENEYNINRFSRLLSNMEINNYDITVQGNLFVIRVNKNMIKDLNIDEDFNLEQVKWLIRGAYLGSGSINNPERKYHLEIGISKKNNAEKKSQIIRVGSFEDTFNYVDKNGVRRGYGYELMQALAGYTGWKFEYVKCDWSNCFDKIENGHIAKPIQVDKLLSIISEIIRQQD